MPQVPCERRMLSTIPHSVRNRSIELARRGNVRPYLRLGLLPSARGPGATHNTARLYRCRTAWHCIARMASQTTMDMQGYEVVTAIVNYGKHM
eukprot:6177266-Pleurochrysis_carterae.AAC.3